MTRRLLFGLACLVTFGLAWHFRCRHTRAVRHPMGAFACPDCGHKSADMPSLEDPYVPPLRRTFGRERMEGFTRMSGWIQ